MTRRWILDQLGEPTFEQLAAELSGSELQSVLLEVMQRRASARSPAEVLAQYQRDPFCRPAAIDQRCGSRRAWQRCTSPPASVAD